MFKKIGVWFIRGWDYRTAWKLHRKKGHFPSTIGFVISVVLEKVFHNIWLTILPFAFYIGVLVGYEIKQWDLSGLDEEKIKWWFENKCIDSVVDVVMGSYLYIVFITLLLIVRY